MKTFLKVLNLVGAVVTLVAVLMGDTTAATVAAANVFDDETPARKK